MQASVLLQDTLSPTIRFQALKHTLQVSSGEAERLVPPSTPGSAPPGAPAPAGFGAANPTPPLVLMPRPAPPSPLGRAEAPGTRPEAAARGAARLPVHQQWPAPRLNRSGAADSGGAASPIAMDSSAADSANTEEQAGADLCSGPRGSKRSKEDVQKRNKEVRGWHALPDRAALQCLSGSCPSLWSLCAVRQACFPHSKSLQ